jgi:hypothetical protein
VPVTRAFLVDDDARDRAQMRLHLEDAGIDVIEPEATHYEEIDDLVADVLRADVDITICDHRLQPGRLASFFGAEAVASLIGMEQVALLMTSYSGDVPTTIRLHRRGIPAVLRRDQLQQADTLDGVTEAIRREINGIIPPQRQLRPTVVRVGDVSAGEDGLALDVFVTGWRPDQAVRVPAGIVPPEIAALGSALIDRYLVADVNTGAVDDSELYFGSVGPLAEPVEWPATETGSGAEWPLRHAPVTGVFEAEP